MVKQHSLEMTMVNRILIGFLSSVLSALPLFAQTPSAPPDNGKPMERLEQLKKVRMIEMLDLKEDQSVRFFARLNDHDKVRKDLRKERNDVLDKLERLIRNRADAAAYDKVFAEVKDVQDRMLAEERGFADGLKDILTVEQRAKLILFERRFEGELREAIRENRMHRQPGGEQKEP
jgi:hypothetical protein